VARELTLLFHFLGFGLLMTINVAGFILNRQYSKSADLQSKAIILRALRPIGLLSPVAIVVMLVTGIGNMHALGYGLLDAGWLTAKIMFFAIAVISGTLFGIKAKKRGTLVQEMASGKAAANSQELLNAYDKQISLFYLVMPVLLLIILALSIYGRLGGQ
jgi:hypothetical protein